jgi:hypothetical protein
MEVWSMNFFYKAAVCVTLLFVAEGIEAQTSADIPVIQITKESSSVRSQGFRLH